MSKKANSKAVLHSDSSAKADEVLFFRDIEFGPQEGELSTSHSISSFFLHGSSIAPPQQPHFSLSIGSFFILSLSTYSSVNRRCRSTKARPNDGNRTKDGIQIVLMGTIVGTNEISQDIGVRKSHIA
ncbi:hypothetical protein Bca4012_018767 [Brassica carinata]